MISRVSKEVFGKIIRDALASLPEEFGKMMEGIRVEVRDYPSERMQRQGRVRQGQLLLGLYVGRPVTKRSVEDSGALPDVIYLFQRPIEQICNNEEQLERQIRVTLLHEIGHHFGLDEADLSRLGYG